MSVQAPFLHVMEAVKFRRHLTVQLLHAGEEARSSLTLALHLLGLSCQVTVSPKNNLEWADSRFPWAVMVGPHHTRESFHPVDPPSAFSFRRIR